MALHYYYGNKSVYCPLIVCWLVSASCVIVLSVWGCDCPSGTP